MAVFVDTNLLVYWRDASEPVKQARADEWMRRLWKEQMGRTSLQVLSEFYVTVTRKLRPSMNAADAWDDVIWHLAWKPQEVTPDLFQRARKVEQRYGLSWWDSLVVAAAQLQNCSVLLTEDLQDGMKLDGVVVRNPFTSSVNESMPTYADPILPTHARRGRPPGRGRVASAS